MSAQRNLHERRNDDRLAVVVPVTLKSGDEKFTGKLLNLAAGGALIETSAPLGLHSRVQLICGTIDASAFVIWRNSSEYGLKFARSLTEAQVLEQVSRTAAIKAMTVRRFGEQRTQ